MEAKIRKIGNSLGIIFPKEFIERKNLKINDKVELLVIKRTNLKDVFGTLKTKTSGQEFKDFAMGIEEKT